MLGAGKADLEPYLEYGEQGRSGPATTQAGLFY